MFIIIFLSQ